MTKELLEKLKGQTIKKNLYDNEFDVVVTNVLEEDEGYSEYLDGSYTKEELLELVDEMGGSEKVYKVYGKIKNDYDIQAVKDLQELAKQDFYNNLCASGCPFIEEDYNNELLLKIFRDGDEPQY